ncbi:MAG: hypothetical protein COA57_08055, partial [Flavobacteriales bacterium]
VYQLNTDNGLASGNVNHILMDSNTVWLATNKGMNKITFTDYESFNYKAETYNTVDGLASNEINQVTRSGNKIWVATNKGLTFFNPEKLKPDTTPTPIYITGIKIGEEDTVIQDRYELDYTQNHIVINYIGLSYKDPGKLQYTYKMQGIDSTWMHTSNRSVQYTTLPSGDYTFVVSVINGDGYQNTLPATIKFSIAPPFWLTWWFRLLCLVAVIMAVYAFFKIRVLTYNKDVVRELMVLLLNKTKRKKYLVIQTSLNLTKIDTNKILWIQAASNYVEIVTTKKTHLIRISMTSIHEKLPLKQEFLRLHRSYIVRIDKITAINADSVKVGKKDVPVGKSYKAALKELKKQLAL